LGKPLPGGVDFCATVPARSRRDSGKYISGHLDAFRTEATKSIVLQLISGIFGGALFAFLAKRVYVFVLTHPLVEIEHSPSGKKQTEWKLVHSLSTFFNGAAFPVCARNSIGNTK
jgi:hypothetical protein